MSKQEWDLEKIITAEDQKDIAKIAEIRAVAERAEAFLCRVGWHRKTTWTEVGKIQMSNLRPDGREIPWEFEMKMRCCMKCGVPEVRAERI